MRSILILGVGRAGKSTLSRMIKSKYPQYNLLHTDSVRTPFLKLLPAEYLPEFLDYEKNVFFQEFLLEFLASQIRQNRKNDCILEGAQILPSKVHELVDLNSTIVVFLGHGNLTADDIFNLCREHDNELDFSYKITDEELSEHAQDWYKKNELIKKECEKYHFKYVDTSKNREETLKKVFEELCREIEK